jgi:hypothetical protein
MLHAFAPMQPAFARCCRRLAMIQHQADLKFHTVGLAVAVPPGGADLRSALA